MIMTIEEARDTLRVDGSSNDAIITSLLEAIPAYLVTLVSGKVDITGADPLVKTLAKFVLQLWYNPDGTDSDRLQKVIDSLAKTIKARETYLTNLENS